jgi:hypothetical protein
LALRQHSLRDKVAIPTSVGTATERTNVKGFFTILGTALLWAFAASGLAFAAFLVPMFLDMPGAHQAPLGAIILGLPAFLLVLPIAYIVQFRRALRLNGAGKVGYVVVLVLLLVPTVSVVRFISKMFLFQY